MSPSPPKHEMVYFPKLTSEVRAFGQFRKVLHTGLFSQLVSMEIPVGGDIGDEVNKKSPCIHMLRLFYTISVWSKSLGHRWVMAGAEVETRIL